MNDFSSDSSSPVIDVETVVDDEVNITYFIFHVIFIYVAHIGALVASIKHFIGFRFNID